MADEKGRGASSPFGSLSVSEPIKERRKALGKPAARVASLSNRLLRGFGLQLVRVRPEPADVPLPPLEDHPVAALLASRVGRKVAFPCPVASIVALNGLRFGERGWHPFSAALRSYRSDGRLAAQAVLDRFYSGWQPADAAAAIAGFHERPKALRSVPPHAYHFSPWSDKTLQQELAQIARYYQADYVEHGCAGLRLDVDGFKHHGPVSPQLARVELDRLLRVYESLAEQGYDRRHGHVHVYLLRRGGELRFVCRGGLHRLAAVDALGQECVPATLCAPYVVEADESEHWPQVANGCWDGEAARRYFHHLFDFDAFGWALALGLAGGPGEAPSESRVESGTAQARAAAGARVLEADVDAGATADE